MKILKFIILVLLTSGSVHAQNRGDSVVADILWNRIDWSYKITQYDLIIYSNQRNVFEYILNESGTPSQVVGYYFDGEVAIRAELISNISGSPRPESHEYKMTTYYPNGHLRSSIFHFGRERLENFYSDEGKLIYTEQIDGLDTICGVYQVHMDREFNRTFDVYDQGSKVGSFLTDRKLTKYLAIGNFPTSEAEKKYMLLTIMYNPSPYSGF